MSQNCIESIFGKKRVFLPVIHPVSRDCARSTTRVTGARTARS